MRFSALLVYFAAATLAVALSASTASATVCTFITSTSNPKSPIPPGGTFAGATCPTKKQGNTSNCVCSAYFCGDICFNSGSLKNPAITCKGIYSSAICSALQKTQ
jgi:hypothetical protein